MAKEKGKVLMKGKDGELKRFDEDHEATELAEAVEEAGGEITPRAMGFKMTDKDGGRLGFCVPKKEGYVVYLTTIPHDSDILEDLGLEVGKGSSGLAVLKELGKPTKALKTLRSVYAAKAEAEPEEKPKKAKGKAKDDEPKKVKKGKKSKAKDDSDGDGDSEVKTARRKKRRKGKKADDDE